MFLFSRLRLVCQFDVRDVVTCFLQWIFWEKVSRRVENAYQTPKFGAVGGQSPSPSLSLRTGEGKRRVLLATGPAASLWYVFLITLVFCFFFSLPLYYVHGTPPTMGNCRQPMLYTHIPTPQINLHNHHLRRLWLRR